MGLLFNCISGKIRNINPHEVWASNPSAVNEREEERDVCQSTNVSSERVILQGVETE